MALELSYHILSTLPAGTTSRTRLALRDGRRKVVLRMVREGVEPFLPDKTPDSVLPLIELFEQLDTRHAVYDYVPGVTFRELVGALREEERHVPVALAVRVVLDAARAMGVLHGRHPPVPAHGGLSDASIFIGFDGAVRVLDYGVPRPSRFQPSVPGSAHGDVFALGAVLHSVLTGFTGSYADAVDEGVPLPLPSAMHPEATPALDSVVTRAISRAFVKRQVDAGTLADELEAVQGDALFTHEDLAKLLGRLFSSRLELSQSPGAPSGRTVKLDPESSTLGDDSDAPTGAHSAPWLRDGPPVDEAEGTRRAVMPWATGASGPGVSAAAPTPGTDAGGPSPALVSRIPSGTEPGSAGPFAAGATPADVREPAPDGTQPHIELSPAPVQPLVSRAAETAVDRPRPSSGGTSALRGDGAEELAADREAPVTAVATTKKPSAGAADTGDGDEDDGKVAAPPSEDVAHVRSSTRRAGERSKEVPPAPSLADGYPEATRPRARVPLENLDTHPRAHGPAADASPLESLETAPRASAPRPRNTTAYEKRRARGQERIPTPPLGMPAASPMDEIVGDVANEPTNVRPRPKSPALDSERAPPTTAEAASPRPMRRWLAGLLLFIALGFGAVALFAPQKLATLEEKLGLAPFPEPRAPEEGALDLDDAGPAAPEPDGGASAHVAALGLLDGGDEAEDGTDSDAGGEEEDEEAPDRGGDAGGALADTGTSPDAGPTLDAGSAPKPAVKSHPKKKKKKRRRR